MHNCGQSPKRMGERNGKKSAHLVETKPGAERITLGFSAGQFRKKRASWEQIGNFKLKQKAEGEGKM